MKTKTPTRRPNLAAQAATDTAMQQAIDAQDAVNNVIITNMREFTVAQDNATEAARLAREAGIAVGNVKIAIMLKLADAANRLGLPR